MNESRGRGRELLHDTDDVERDDVEAAGAVVEHAQAQQVAEVQRVVADRLLRDEDPVGRARAAAPCMSGRAAAEEVGVAQRGRAS